MDANKNILMNIHYMSDSTLKLEIILIDDGSEHSYLRFLRQCVLYFVYLFSTIQYLIQ
jgi:hypothetical protein